METKFSLYFSILKSALVVLFLFTLSSDVSFASSVVPDKVVPAASNPANKDAKPVEAVVSADPLKKEMAVVGSNVAMPVADPIKGIGEKKVALEEAAVVIGPAKKLESNPMVSGSSNVTADPAKRVEEKAPVVPVRAGVVADSSKKVEGVGVASMPSKDTILPSEGVVSANTPKVSTEKAHVPAVVEPAKPTVVVAADEVMVSSLSADGKKDVVVASDKVMMSSSVEGKKDAAVLMSSSQEALKAELLAELKVILKKQIDDIVSEKMSMLNAPASVGAGGSDTRAVMVKDDKKLAEAAGATLDHKTPCNMLTSATCSQNPTDCLIFKGYCLPKCQGLTADICEKTPHCKLSGIVIKTCAAAA